MEAANLERRGNAQVPVARNASYPDILALLQTLQSRRVDVVVPAEKMRFHDGMLQISGQEAVADETGVTDPNGTYWPTAVFDSQLAERLDIPIGYLRRLRNGRTNAEGKELTYPRLDIYDMTANGLLHGRRQLVRPRLDGESEVLRSAVPHDPRSFTARLLSGVEGEPGIARSLLSNRYAPLENIDGLAAVLDGVAQAGVDPAGLRITGDLSETRMYIKISAPGILAAAPGLLDGYRSPFGDNGNDTRKQGAGYSLAERIEMGRAWREGNGRGQGHQMYAPGSEPLVHAGLLFTNSEVGYGRWSIRPYITVLACTNGLCIVKDGFARAHVGSRQEDGVVRWSMETQSAELRLVAAQTTDVIRAVMSVDWLEKTLADLEAKAGRVIEHPDRAIEVVSRRLAFTDAEREGIFRHFLVAGQMTSGGVLNAVTSYSQVIDDPDRSHEVNDRAIEAMEIAFAMS